MTSKKLSKEEKATRQLCKTLNQQNLTNREIANVLPQFLFSIGASLEDCSLQSSEEVLKRYAEEPTFGNALMAQSLWMKETWALPNTERETKDD